MQHFDIVRSTAPKETFRVKAVMGSYDMQSPKVTEHFVGDIDLPKEWNIGLIVGRSGSGKTTIAQELFGDDLVRRYEYTHESVIDDMPASKSVNEICRVLSSVGFSSPPSWLKPYAVLSNGEKMRCDLARAILEDKEMFAFDEFTSVVDRNVAKVASLAMQKAIRRGGRKFIAISCHFDIEPWLMPDWVLDMDTITFSAKDLAEQKKNRPGIRLEVYEVRDNAIKERYWAMFSRYHYLKREFCKGARTWVAYADGNLAGFCSFLNFPLNDGSKIKKAHRIVVFPDYQGVGIGKAMLDICAGQLHGEGERVTLTTSNIAMIFALKFDKRWRCVRIGRASKPSRTIMKSMVNCLSCNRLTYNFEFVK